MTNQQAKVLNSCKIIEYYSIFEKPTPKAKIANGVVFELTMSDLKKLYLQKIDLLLKDLKKESANTSAKLEEINGTIEELKSKFAPQTLEGFNEYVINCFKINEINIDKNLSMLDFWNLQRSAERIIKHRDKILNS